MSKDIDALTIQNHQLRTELQCKEILIDSYVEKIDTYQRRFKLQEEMIADLKKK